MLGEVCRGGYHYYYHSHCHATNSTQLMLSFAAAAAASSFKMLNNATNKHIQFTSLVWLFKGYEYPYCSRWVEHSTYMYTYVRTTCCTSPYRYCCKDAIESVLVLALSLLLLLLLVTGYVCGFAILVGCNLKSIYANMWTHLWNFCTQ